MMPECLVIPVDHVMSGDTFAASMQGIEGTPSLKHQTAEFLNELVIRRLEPPVFTD